MMGASGRPGATWILSGSRGQARKLKRRVERRVEKQAVRREAGL